jgi:hypothetical protein
MATTYTIKTMALIDRALYDKFRALRKQMVSDGIGDLAKVFVPVGAAAPSRLNRKAPRVLFVGKGTNGWNEGRLDSFDGSKRQAEDILKDFCGLTNRSAFWQFSRAVLRQALRSCNVEADDVDLASFSGWSNLVLIGNTGSYSPPKGPALDRQKGLCIEALRAEIIRFRPTAVVLVSQAYAMHEIAHPVFGGHDSTWSFDTPQQDSVAWKFHPDLETTVVWTNHPQGMRPPGTRARVQALVADLVARATQGQSLPRSA